MNVQAPAQSPVVSTISVQNGTADQDFQLDLSHYATDPNTPALTLTYALGAIPPTGASLTPAGLLTWTPPISQAAGAVTINFTVSNGESTDTPGSFTIDVAAVSSPVLQSIPTQNATAGQPFQVNLSHYASDTNNPILALHYSLGANAPGTAVLNPSSGIFSWTPPTSQAAGPVTIDFSVSNGGPSSSSGSFQIDVAAAPLSPVVRSVPEQDGTAGQPFEFNLAPYASDPNTPPLSLNFGLASNLEGTRSWRRWATLPGYRRRTSPSGRSRSISACPMVMPRRRGDPS